MSQADQSQLVSSLVQSYSNLQSAIKGIDPETIIYDESSWQIRDILWHIAVWDQQVTKSILAFNDGNTYSIPNFDEDQFNQAAYLEGKKLTLEQLLEDSYLARQEFKDAIQGFPVGKFSSEFLFPWGDESGDITTLVGYMIEHDEEHLEEITRVLG